MNKPQQLFFRFPLESKYHLDDFFVTSANLHAFNYLREWPNWNNGVFGNLVLLSGEKGSGKTHLAHVWQSMSNAKIISSINDFLPEDKALILENIENYNDEDLLHLINFAKEGNKYLLLTSSLSPSNIKFNLPDLVSRIRSIPSVAIDAPDYELLKAVLVKYLMDRDLKIQLPGIDYVIPRIDRSFYQLFMFIEKIEELSKTTKRPITINLIKNALEYLVGCEKV